MKNKIGKWKKKKKKKKKRFDASTNKWKWNTIKRDAFSYSH